jgi:hypothetical protein
LDRQILAAIATTPGVLATARCQLRGGAGRVWEAEMSTPLGHPVSTPMNIWKPKIGSLMLNHGQGRPRQTPGLGRYYRRLDSHA